MSVRTVAEPLIDVHSLLSVATATMDLSGTLIEANGEFLRLIGASGVAGAGVARNLVQPGFHDLARSVPGHSGQIYDGLLTITDVNAVSRTLHARIWRDAERIWLVAEHDVAGMERLNSTVLELNQECAQAHLQVVQSQIRLNQLNAELERRVEERTSALRVALDRAQAADRAKTAFLRMASHELRTPLNAIIGLSSLLLANDTGSLSTEQREQLAIIERSGDRMLELVKNILDAAMIESGELRVDVHAVDLRGILDDLCESTRPSAREAGIELKAPEFAEPLMVMADDVRLRQALGNLLSNAIKYTDRGRAQVRAVVDGAKVRIEVEDTGIGIASDQQLHLFQAFGRIVDRTTKQRPGSGLGLSIARRLVEAMGGEIGVRSEPGVGSCFWCTVPLAPAGDPRR